MLHLFNITELFILFQRPAVVTAEPVYANNRPEHYAVSAKFPQPMMDTGAIAKTPRPLGPGLPGVPDTTPKASDVLLGAVGKLFLFSNRLFIFTIVTAAKQFMVAEI